MSTFGNQDVYSAIFTTNVDDFNRIFLLGFKFSEIFYFAVVYVSYALMSHLRI